MAGSEGLMEVPSDMPAHHRRFFTQMRNLIIAVQQGRSVVAGVSNVKLTPVGAGIVIQFTRPLDADGVTLYTSTKPDFSAAVPVQLGLATVYRDECGTAVERWYWLKTQRGLLGGQQVGPFTATSLAAGTAAAIPTAPPALREPITDVSTGHRISGSGRIQFE